jgi:two-component system, LytTR family, response regulator
MNGTFTFMIVEDEARARETLLHKIKMCNIANITCSGMAANAKEALLLAEITPPDFIFLDINLPGMNGFDLITELNHLNIFPQIIFTSAHTESSILLEALKKTPSSYLVKPIDIDELEAAIRKICQLNAEKQSMTDRNAKIRFNTYEGFLYLFPNEVMMLKSDSNKSVLHTKQGKCIKLTNSLGSFDEKHRVSFPPFFRVDRCTIINTDFVEHIYLKRGIVTLQNESQIIEAEISKNGIKKIMEKFDKAGE